MSIISLEDARILSREAIKKSIEDQINEQIIQAAKEGYCGVDLSIADPEKWEQIMENGTDDDYKLRFTYDHPVIKDLVAAGYAVYIENRGRFSGKDKGYSTLSILWYDNAKEQVQKQIELDLKENAPDEVEV